MESIEERLDRIENRSKVNLFEVEKRLVALETGRSDTVAEEMRSKVNEIGDHMILLNSEITRIKEMLSSGPGLELPHNINERLENIEHELDEMREEDVETELVQIPEEINRRLDYVEQTLESVRALEEMLIRLEAKIEDLAMFKPPTEHYIKNMEAGIRTSFEERLKEVNDNLKEFESRITESETRLPEDIEKRLEYVEKEASDLADMKRLLDEEVASRLSLEKKVKSINIEPAAPSVSVENVRSDIDNLRALIDDTNKNMEMRSVKFLTKNLEEFARVLDKKLMGMEAPRLDARLRSIEQKLEKINSVVHNLLGSMPVIVE